MKTFLCLLGFCALACSTRAADPAPSGRPDTGNLLYREVVAAAIGYDEIIVWEGLPSEKAQLAQELTTKKTFLIGNQPFYSQRLDFKDADKAALHDAILGHRENFKKWSGPKPGGDFHADYAVEWRSKGAIITQALFCFSCSEVEFRVGLKTERVDLANTAVRDLLASHHAQRPATKSAP